MYYRCQNGIISANFEWRLVLISACLLIAGICLIFFIKIKWNVVPCALLVVAIVLLVSGNFFRFPLTYQVLSVSSIAFLYCAVVFAFSKKESRELVMKDYNTKQEKWMSWTAFSCGTYLVFFIFGLPNLMILTNSSKVLLELGEVDPPLLQNLIMEI